jgi:hypothetical protein
MSSLQNDAETGSLRNLIICQRQRGACDKFILLAFGNFL